MKRFFDCMLVVSILALSGCTDTVQAEESLCDREIEGVTVRMSVEEARAIWLARGYFEISTAPQAGMRGGAKTSTVKETAFTNHVAQANEGYVPGRISMLLRDTGPEINLSKQFHDEDGSISSARIAEFCPQGENIRSAKLACVGIQNGKRSGRRLNITVNPEDPETANRCTYAFNNAGLVHEYVRLSREPDPLAAPSASEITRL